MLRVTWDNRLVKGIFGTTYVCIYKKKYCKNINILLLIITGCPLSVVVSGGADASLVTCSGVGLSQGVVGKEIRSWIDTRRAGPGELTAHCTGIILLLEYCNFNQSIQVSIFFYACNFIGPHKVAYCELYEHGDATFTLNVKPQEAGRHQLTVKYAGEHVPGSPFQLRVAGAPDASKVIQINMEYYYSEKYCVKLYLFII